MAKRGNSDLVDVDAVLVHETYPDDTESGAFLIDTGSVKVWVPKVACQRDGNTFTMSERLAMEKGLI